MYSWQFNLKWNLFVNHAYGDTLWKNGFHTPDSRCYYSWSIRRLWKAIKAWCIFDFINTVPMQIKGVGGGGGCKSWCFIQVRWKTSPRNVIDAPCNEELIACMGKAFDKWLFSEKDVVQIEICIHIINNYTTYKWWPERELDLKAELVLINF